MPKFLPKEQVKAMVRDGLAKMRREGNPMLVQMDQAGDQEIEGPHFDKTQQRLFNSLTEVAVIELAEHQFDPWEQSNAAIKELMLGVGFTRQNVIDTWGLIETTACELAQEPNLGTIARQWMRLKHSRVFTGPMM